MKRPEDVDGKLLETRLLAGWCTLCGVPVKDGQAVQHFDRVGRLHRCCARCDTFVMSSPVTQGEAVQDLEAAGGRHGRGR